MSLSDPSDTMGTIAQIQFMSQSGAFTVPMRMKWLPSSLAGTATPDDVRKTFENLKAIVKVDLAKIMRGGDIPPDIDEKIRALDEAVVRLRYANEEWKQKMAEELLTPLLGELGPFSGFDNDDPSDDSTPAEFRHPTWLKLYRALCTHDLDLQFLRGTIEIFADASPEQTTAGITALTLMGHLSDADDLNQLLRTIVRTNGEHPGCWKLLFSPAFANRLRNYAPAGKRCHLLYSVVTIIGETAADGTARAKLLNGLFQGITDDETFHEVTCRLAALVLRSPGIAPEVIALFTKPRLAEVPALMTCLCPSPQSVASNDAQFIIGRVLARNKLADNKVFRKFCKRTAGLDLSTNLKNDFAERVLDNNELLRPILQQKLDLTPIASQLRQATATRQQLLCLLLMAVQSFEGEDLREISRALSLIDVAVRQSKIDSRHLDILMSDLTDHPLEALPCLADESQLDTRLKGNKDLSLLYLTLRITSQTADKVDGFDIDHLSGTLRQLRSQDRRQGR